MLSAQPERIVRRRRTDPPTRHSNEGSLGTLGTIGASATDRRQRQHSKRQKPPSPAAGQHSEVKFEDGAPNLEASIHEESSSGEAAVDIGTTNGPLDDSLDSVVPNNDPIEDDVHFDPDSHSTFRAVMLVIALSCHATFEGQLEAFGCFLLD